MHDYNDCCCDLCQQRNEINDIDKNTGQLILSNNTGIPNTSEETTRINSQVSIKHCSLCPGTTEYYCHDCKVTSVDRLKRYTLIYWTSNIIT